MKQRPILFLVMVSLNGCTGQGTTGFKDVHQTHDSVGRVVEEWGYDEGEDGNYRKFLFYNEDAQLIKVIYYSLGDDRECRIVDSLSYAEFIYEYKEGKLYLEKRYDQTTDDSGKVLERSLTYVFNHFTKDEDPSSPNKSRHQ